MMSHNIRVNTNTNTNVMMMAYLPIEKPDDTEHQNKYKEGGGESGTAKRSTCVSLLSMVNYL